MLADASVDVVHICAPNHLHEDAVSLAAAAGKAVLCTKPLGRTADEARRMLETVERAGVFGGYLEDLCYTPKTLKAIRSVEQGALGSGAEVADLPRLVDHDHGVRHCVKDGAEVRLAPR